MRTFEEVQDELRECIGHAYRDDVEDIQKFGGNIEHLDKATHLLNELIEVHKGEWIYDKNIENWRCSRCGQTPPPTGYVGKADFMATHFKFCPNCGADMRGDKAE